MDEVHDDEMMLRITAQFVAEQEAGLEPRLADYIQRYPRYADEIVDFLTYYYAWEASLTVVPELSMGGLAPAAQSALDIAWSRLAIQPVAALETPARRQGYSLEQLASLLDLSHDLLKQLFCNQVVAATVPRELLLLLSRLLAQPIELVRQSLASFERSIPSVVAEEGTIYPFAVVEEGFISPSVLVEERAMYALSVEPGQAPLSFREALMGNSQLSTAQKARWLTILEREGL